MGTWEKILYENNVRFIYWEFTFFVWKEHESITKIFMNVFIRYFYLSECYSTHNFYKISSLQDGTKA